MHLLYLFVPSSQFSVDSYFPDLSLLLMPLMGLALFLKALMGAMGVAIPLMGLALLLMALMGTLPSPLMGLARDDFHGSFPFHGWGKGRGLE